MKASELRVGNLILKNGKLHYTSYLTIRDIHGLSIDDTDTFEPIPITEERLMIFGFKKLSDKLIVLSIPKLKSELHYETYYYGNVVTIHSDFGTFIPNDIEYVHQLQNLYFALTGEELTINQ